MVKFQKSSDLIKYREEIALEIYFNDLKESQSLIGIKEKYIQDTIYTLKYLSTSIEMNEPLIFINYMKWFGSLAHHLRFSIDHMNRHFNKSLEVFQKVFDTTLFKTASHVYKEGIKAFEISFLAKETIVVNYDPFLNHLIQMNSEQAYLFVLNEIENGMSIKEVYLNILQPTLYKTGELWHQRKISVAKEHYITAAIQHIIGRLYQQLFKHKEQPKYKVTAVCAGDELHEIGMRMVADFFEISNWDSYFLGSNIPVSVVLNQLVEQPTDLLAISATTSSHLVQVRDLIQAVRNHPTLKKTKIIVGGRAFNETPNLWKMIQADGYAFDAEQAVMLGNTLVGEDYVI
jgi:MerR family transcriptional regulator, light-induced transcriptional regulator